MKNILFLGNYKSQSGWGVAAKEYLEALLLTEHNIVARPVFMSNEPLLKPSKKIIEAENNRFDKSPDIVIQNVLPDLFEKHEGYNIGIIHTETRNCNKIWINKINLLDELWVNSELEKVSLQKDGVVCKISVVPIPVNTKNLEKYQRFAEDLQIPELNGKYIFYFIGEHTDRKNILALVQAFHREFDYHEPVSLLIKTNNQSLKDEVNEWHKTSRTRSSYIPEIFVAGQVEEKFIYSIHKTAHCFVCTSRGESNCLPIADALFFNNEVICVKGTYPSDIYYPNAVAVDSQRTPVNTKSPPINHIYTGQEYWFDVDILQLQAEMRKMYENRNNQKTTGKSFIIDNFSREAISEKIKLCLSSTN